MSERIYSNKQKVRELNSTTQELKQENKNHNNEIQKEYLIK